MYILLQKIGGLKMKRTLIICLAIILGLQTTVYSQTDTIYNRYKHYHYTSWYDSCYASGSMCYLFSTLNESNDGAMRGVYHFTNQPIEIIGIAGGVVSTEFQDATRVPEYFLLFDDINGNITFVDSARWDTARHKVMGVETLLYPLVGRIDTIDGVPTWIEYTDTVYEMKYIKIMEAYFKSPVRINDSFYIAATSYNNVYPGIEGGSYGDGYGYIHQATLYVGGITAQGCKRYNPEKSYIDGRWSGYLVPQLNINEYYDFLFPIIKVLDTFDIIGMSHDETQGRVEGSGQYVKYSTVTLTAIPNEGYKFVMWNDSVTDNPRVFYAEQDTAFTAYFAPAEQYVVSVESSDLLQGTVSGGGTYYENTSVEIVAQANEGYKFTMWNDSVTDNPRTIVVSQDTLFTAYFEIKIGINEAENNTALFTISPNPATNNLQITIGESGKYTMEIYSVNGTMVKQEQITQSSTIDVSALVSGNYFIKIYNSTTTGIKAFVKQ